MSRSMVGMLAAVIVLTYVVVGHQAYESGVKSGHTSYQDGCQEGATKLCGLLDSCSQSEARRFYLTIVKDFCEQGPQEASQQ